jgi:hypothetical protein
MAPRAAATLTALAALLLGGCPATCDAMCSKLDRCGFDDRISELDCREQCGVQLEVLGDKDTDDGDPAADEAARDAFRAHRVCVGNRSCDELAEGACYDPLVFPF